MVKTVTLLNVTIGKCAVLFEDFPRNIPAATAGASVLFLLLIFFSPKNVFLEVKMQNVSELSLWFQMPCIMH